MNQHALIASFAMVMVVVVFAYNRLIEKRDYFKAESSYWRNLWESEHRCSIKWLSKLYVLQKQYDNKPNDESFLDLAEMRKERDIALSCSDQFELLYNETKAELEHERRSASALRGEITKLKSKKR